jgi:3-hydroxypropionyl-coenzyme A dehydratase
MILAHETERIGLINKVVSKVVSVTTKEKYRLLNTINMTLTTNNSKEEKEQQEKQRANKLAKFLNIKLMNECICFAKQITKNSFSAIKTSKILINSRLNTDIDTGLRLETYGWALCFTHKDRLKMMSSFLNKGKKD